MAQGAKDWLRKRHTSSKYSQGGGGFTGNGLPRQSAEVSTDVVHHRRVKEHLEWASAQGIRLFFFLIFGHPSSIEVGECRVSIYSRGLCEAHSSEGAC